MLSGFTAKQLVRVHMPEEPSYVIEVAETGEAAAGEEGAAEAQVDILALIANADIAKGEKLSKACAACHSFEKGGPNRVGPNLWGVVGGPIMHRDDFAYSEAMAAHKGQVWTYENIDHFITKPKQFAPGTKMSFIGMKKPEDRAAVIAWLRTMSDAPIPLPEAQSPAVVEDGQNKALEQAGEDKAKEEKENAE